MRKEILRVNQLNKMYNQEQEITETSEGQEQKESEEEITESWDEGVFEYQGYHFEAVGVLPDGRRHRLALSA